MKSRTLSLPRCGGTGSAGLSPPPRFGRLRLRRFFLGEADFTEFGRLGDITRALVGDDGASRPVGLRQAELCLGQRGCHLNKTHPGVNGSFPI